MRLSAQSRLALESTFWAVSDPLHPNYGDFLTPDDIREMLNISSVAVRAVVEFIQLHGGNAAVNPTSDLISVSIPLTAAETMLQTRIRTYRSTGGRTIHRCAPNAGYSLPNHIADHVWMVSNLMQFPKTGNRAPRVNKPAFDHCQEGWILPKDVMRLYSLDGSTIAPALGSTGAAVAEFAGEYWSSSDLQAFATEVGLPKINVIDATQNNDEYKCIEEPYGSCEESHADIEILGSLLGPRFNLSSFYFDDYDLMSWAAKVGSLSKPPSVHSISYGQDENQTAGADYMNALNSQFMQLGVRGVSVLVSSGDAGVWGREGFFVCTTTGHFNPAFPASSPYVTSVGGTDFKDGADFSKGEAGSQYSGGGFSLNFARPQYQDAAVESYLSKARLPPASYFNRNGRAFPDISANFGHVAPYCIRSQGEFHDFGGTSASCPVVAAAFALLNEKRLAAGGKPLGFLNPFLYQTAVKSPQAFTDIVTGTNKADCPDGFDAIAGFDPVTGVGTPVFVELLKLI
jgi:tripeptidyl-peptidase-1